MSTKSAVTGLRSSSGGAWASSGAPQARQNRAISGFSVPHAEQPRIVRV